MKIPAKLKAADVVRALGGVGYGAQARAARKLDVSRQAINQWLAAGVVPESSRLRCLLALGYVIKLK